ncbi:BamA/TamA family outer membrane protein [Hufsiella ginkgonis]|uniref:BamA/TamA family outer membrane protein n=1 Tax=Hufsiella ginkgonis TaxID=2695274 RepID=A0A7K1Y4I7_9SPHI|nr:BamA/TamA family outer membrane protein [Hufsiella ginkgonis]MXV17636.1 BamA/TamA family outer membrane protein [Hufsiella ginkgonis]
MRRAILIIFIALESFTPNRSFSQKKLIKKFFSGKQDSTRAGSFLALPSLSYAQETGLEFGAAAVYAFHTDRQDLLTRSSSINVIATFTTKKQSNFKVQADIWSPGNRWHRLTEIRYKNFPFNFYGIGPNTAEADKDVVVQKLFRINQEVERRFGRRYYAGITLLFDQYLFRDKQPGGIFSTGTRVRDPDGGKVLFAGISQVFDNRNSNTYTTTGNSIKINLAFAPDLFGGENYTGGLLRFDTRSFLPINKKKNIVAGLNVVGQSIRSGRTPFYLLPQLGNDQVMRGYYTGRYRDKNLLAAQVELRYRFIPRLGVAAFAGAGKVKSGSEQPLDGFKPSFGAGGRYFFDINRGLSVRFDYGIGEKRPGEHRQQGFYISLGEAF